MRAARVKYLCTTCQVSMSRWYTKNAVMKCGACGGQLSYVHHKFRAPPKRNDRFWKVIRYLEAAGQIRVLDRGSIPQNMQAARALVDRKRQAEVENSSQHKREQAHRMQRRRRDVLKKRRSAIKRRQWAKWSRTGKL